MKKSAARFLCVILAIALLLTALPITVYAEGGVVKTASTAEELTSICEEINTNGGEYTIKLMADINGGYIGITKSGADVTVIGNGHTIFNNTTAVYAENGAKIKLGDGQTALTLKADNRIPGDGGVSVDQPGLIYVLSGSTCEMNDRVTLKDRRSNNQLGGGVSVNGGTFLMNGGTIENCGIDGGSVCYGGGVAVFNGGYFEMKGGTIKDCYVQSVGNSWQTPWVAGGGVFVCRANFTMNGGTIENCSATNYETSEKIDALGGGVAVITSLDGVYDYNGYGYLDSNFTMNGGIIKGCTSEIGGGALAAGLWYVDNKAIAAQEATVHGSDNPGIFLNGGAMTGNDSSMGGAIFLCQIRPSVSIKNMLLDSNSAQEGAAINIFYRYTHAQIENCTITKNTSDLSGGAIMLDSNTYSSGTHLKDTIIQNNTSGDRGAGVCYDANSKLTISGANTIQNNTYNGKLNNLNILSKDYPVYVDGALSGSQIGLSDPTLWDDGKEDFAADAVSTEYLTSGYKTYNTGISPSDVFTSDHESWFADYSDVNTNEVRLVRKKPDYHINNDVIDDNYGNNDIFTDEVEAKTGEIKVGETIKAFYTVPEVTPTKQNSCPYIFKGWYYDQANDDDSHPVSFGTDKYTKDIYAHWIKVDNVAQDEEDDNILPGGDTQYGGFDLAGVQVREGIRDTNFGEVKKPGGLRFLTSLSMDVVNQINAITGKNNIEYGYVAATDVGWIGYHNANNRKLLYVSDSDTPPNGIDTASNNALNENYFGFAHNVNCTSEKINSASDVSVVRLDHRNYQHYLLYTLVITYEDVDESAYEKDVLARPYIKYTDANGLKRVAYSEYRGNANTLGGCYTSYNAIAPQASN